MKDERMDGYLQFVRNELENFMFVQIKQIPWSQNSHADALVRLATRVDSIPVGKILQPAIELAEATLMMIDSKQTWLDKII